MNQGKSLIRLVVGIMGLIFVYSKRPPSGFGDALMMMGQGRDSYIKEPVYLILMALFGFITLFGVMDIVKAENKANKENSENKEK